jgi:hypothetical protein
MARQHKIWTLLKLDSKQQYIIQATEEWVTVTRELRAAKDGAMQRKKAKKRK